MTELTDLVAPDAIMHGVTATSRNDLLAQMAAVIEASYAIPAASVLESAMEREHLGGTGVGEGVAVPHARLRGIDHTVGALAILTAPVDFDAPDGRDSDIVFLLVSPVDAGADHLKALARVSRVLRKPEMRTALRSAQTGGALYGLITAHSPVQAA
ncbi:MAG: PTS sugar transporter subunit IIA [Hyphomonadaceae bacterium]|jgi:PTS system nitrogen regulatory IIA component|nr:PTS sugar transporter subunit IIA [Hyphomonadaceae bacterium]